MKRIYFTVTNDLSYDQRMHRICTSLAAAGYDVTLVGRKLQHSLPLKERSFRQHRIRCFFNKGFLFYAEYNTRLFFYLLAQKTDGICSIDLDTIIPGLLVSQWKGIPRIYDAHEFFTELKEVQTRPRVQRFWRWVEKKAVPRFHHGYTVGEGLAQEFSKRYNRCYAVIRNLPVLKELEEGKAPEPFLLYQGAVNEGRAFEYLIPAMKNVPYPLVVCGDGNFMHQLKTLISEHGVEDKVQLKGMLLPEQLWEIAPRASLGMGLAEREGLNQFLALPNKFFDYMQAGVPQVAMNYPEYRKINEVDEVAVLVDTLDPTEISQTINSLMQDQQRLHRLRQHCLAARKKYCWQEEEKKLLHFYQKIFTP